ncbi:2954_t:CDS:10 [Ambispora gerdemannii]|uniref:2954_t:CDS:1 n=1 Tax=Ambispora gerdemannii TaxID=144530 RepID=A0A9N8WCK2_9GLOM|nr:2954_t:CDS:10 [Ambispora gerdemannii]
MIGIENIKPALAGNAVWKNCHTFSSFLTRRAMDEFIVLSQIKTLKEIYDINKKRRRPLPEGNSYKYEHSDLLNSKISLLQNDITNLKIDAIGGGVDGAIHRAAGPGLRRECLTLGGCDTGDAKITKGYDLPYVIHTVGPIGEDQNALRSCYQKCMDLFHEYKLKTIAFSNISTGIYGYPRVPAGTVALCTIRAWLENQKDLDDIDRIIFCVFENENKFVYEELLPKIFPPPYATPEEIEEEEEKARIEEKARAEREEEKRQRDGKEKVDAKDVDNEEKVTKDEEKEEEGAEIKENLKIENQDPKVEVSTKETEDPVVEVNTKETEDPTVEVNTKETEDPKIEEETEDPKVEEETEDPKVEEETEDLEMEVMDTEEWVGDKAFCWIMLIMDEDLLFI